MAGVGMVLIGSGEPMARAELGPRAGALRWLLNTEGAQSLPRRLWAPSPLMPVQQLQPGSCCRTQPGWARTGRWPEVQALAPAELSGCSGHPEP